MKRRLEEYEEDKIIRSIYKDFLYFDLKDV